MLLGPVIYVVSAPITFFSKNNLFIKNEGRTLIELGGIAYTCLSDATFYLEHEVYFKNIGFQGVNVFFSSKAFEYNSIYMKNIGIFVSCFATGNVAFYVGRDIKFIMNIAKKFGCVASLDTSFIYIENSLFYNLISYQRSGCFVIWDRTNVTVMSSLFSFNEFNLVEIDSSEESIFSNCSFLNNSAPKRIFDVIRSNIVIKFSWFSFNKGSIITLAENSKLELRSLFSKNLVCNEDLIGVDRSIVTLSDSFFSEIELKGSLYDIYLSTIFCERISIRYISVEKNGAFVSAELSYIYVDEIYIFEIAENCFYLIKCFLDITKGYYVFKNKKNIIWKENSGVMQARFSQAIYIRNFFFEGYLQNLTTNRFLYFVNNPVNVNISNSYFKNGFATKDGGSGYIMDTNITFYRCYFKANVANRGGSIFFTSSTGNLLFYIFHFVF